MSEGKTTKEKLGRLGQYGVYLLVRGAVGILHLVPLGLAARVGAFFGRIAYFLDGTHRRLAIRNLRIAFGKEWTEKQIRQTARDHFASLGANILCGFKLPLMQESQLATRVTVEGLEHIAHEAQTGNSLLFGVFHLSCWELLTQVPTLFTVGKKPASIYRALDNPFLDKHVREGREKLGYTLFDRSQGFTEPMKLLRSGGAMLGILVDQHAADTGVWCPFFDRLASTTSLAALMSLRCHLPLYTIAVYDDGPGRWRLVINPPVVSKEARPTAEGITAKLNLAAERIIRRAPANWFWVHDRWKTPQPDFLLSSYRRGAAFPVGYERSRLQPFELIVRSPNWLGDACMAFPAVRAIKAGRPDLRLTILAPTKLRELWAALPEVDDIICKDNGESLLTVSRRIRAKNIAYDAAVLLTNSTRSTLELWLAGIPRLVGYHGSLRSKLLHQTIRELPHGTPPEHHARRYLRIVAKTGGKTDDPALFDFAGAAPLSADGRLRIGICAGAEYGPAKRWPLERFAAMANAVSATRPDIEWVLVGAPGEAEMGMKLSGMITAQHQNLVGKTSLTALIETLRGCRALVTNDTGTMHLAAALGVPTISIFGSTEPILTGPLGPQHTVIRHHVPCSPCFKRECPFGHYDCMTGVSPERVGQAVHRFLAK